MGYSHGNVEDQKTYRDVDSEAKLMRVLRRKRTLSGIILEAICVIFR